MSHSSDSIESVVASGYQGKRRDDDIDRAEKIRRERQTLSIGSFAKPFTALGGNFLRLLWRLVVAVAQRVANVFRVNVDVPLSAQGLANGGSTGEQVPVASFAATDQSAPGAPEEAAKTMAKELSQVVAELIAAKPDVQIFKTPTGPAYAAASLQSLGSTLVSAREARVQFDEQLLQLAQDVSGKIGAPVDGVVKLLRAADLQSPLISPHLSAESLDLVGKCAQAKELECQMQLRFCFFAIEGLKAGKLSESDELVGIIRQKVLQFADREMAELIFREESSTDQPESSEIFTHSSLRQLESEKVVVSPPEKSAKVSPAKTSRSRFLGVSVGVVDQDASEREGEGSGSDQSPATRSPRER